MSEQAIVLMEGDFQDYTLSEVLEVTSLCRQLIQVVFSSAQAPRGHLLLKAGQVLEAKVLQSTQQGIHAFYDILQGSFDSFRVLRFKNGSPLKDPLGSLADLMSAPAPAQDLASTPEPASTPDLVDTPAPKPTTPRATPMTPRVTQPLIPPKRADLANGPTQRLGPIPLSKPSSKPLPTQTPFKGSSSPFSKPLNSSSSSLSPVGPSAPSATSLPPPQEASQATVVTPATKSTPAAQSSQSIPTLSVAQKPQEVADDYLETSIFSDEQMRELMLLIEALERQREMLTSIESECQLFDQRFNRVYYMIEQSQHSWRDLHSHQQESVSKLVTSQQSQEQTLLRVSHDLQTALQFAQSAQESSLKKLMEYAQQGDQSLQMLQRSLQNLSGLQTQGQKSAPNDSVNQQLLMEIIKGKEEKRWSHITPMMLVGLFIQVISLVFLSIIVVKLLF